MDVPVERRLAILRSKLTVWQNTYVDAQYDAEIAQDMGSPQRVEQAADRMKQALKAVAWIEKRLAEFET